MRLPPIYTRSNMVWEVIMIAILAASHFVVLSWLAQGEINGLFPWSIVAVTFGQSVWLALRVVLYFNNRRKQELQRRAADPLEQLYQAPDARPDN